MDNFEEYPLMKWRTEDSLHERLGSMRNRAVHPPYALSWISAWDARDGNCRKLMLHPAGVSPEESTLHAWLCETYQPLDADQRRAIETLAILRFNLGELL